MYPKPIQRLIDLFSKFPGIGPRQATRFVFYILKSGTAGELALTLSELNEKVAFCSQCFRSVEVEPHSGLNPGQTLSPPLKEKGREEAAICSLCHDSKRDPALIAIVEKESDLQSIEKVGAYHGLYHVLGGVIDPLDSQGPQRLHLKELFARIKNLLEKGEACEVLLATNPTTEGDTTALYIERVLEPLKKHYSALKISRLGRGLSLGSELEHVDEITLKQALINRK